MEEESKIRQLNDRILSVEEENRRKNGEKDKKIKELSE
jgi:hypothetical protein